MSESVPGGSRIRDARLARGIGVRELARRTGHTPRAVTEWERSEARGSIRPETLAKVLSIIESDLGGATRDERSSAELHRAVARKLLDHPAQVHSILARNVEKLRGDLPAAVSAEWDRLLRDETPELMGVLLGTDPRAAGLRRDELIDGVLSFQERRAALQRVRYSGWLHKPPTPPRTRRAPQG